MNIILPLEIIRFIPLIFVLGYAAYKDWRNIQVEDGEKVGVVPNKTWLYSIIGGALTLTETLIVHNSSFLYLELISVAITFGFAFLTNMLGGGGADSKAYLTLGVSAPLFPVWSNLFPLPLPIVVIAISSLIAIPFGFFMKSNKPLLKRKIRFLPFIFIGLLVCLII